MSDTTKRHHPEQHDDEIYMDKGAEMTKPGWINRVDDREVRVQTADGEEIKLYLTYDGRLWMCPVIGSNGSKRLAASPVDANWITLDVKVTAGAAEVTS